MIIETYKDIEIQAGGLVYEGVTAATANIDVNDPTVVYRLISTGTPTMSTNLTVATTGTPVKGNKVILKYEATPDFNSNTLTLMGLTIDEAYETKKFIVESIYDGSAWNSVMKVDFDQADIIIENSIKADAVTSAKIKDDAVTTAKIIDGAITTAKLDSSIISMKVLKIPVTTAEVLALNTTTKTLLADSATESYYLMAAAFGSDAGGTTPYATNTTLQIFQNGAQDPVFEQDLLAFATGINKKYTLAPYTSVINRDQIQGNKGYYLKVKTGDPTAGDSDINIWLYYIVIT